MVDEIGPIDGIYYCPHETGTCDCRKPGTGMLLQAARDLDGVELAGSTMIGDSPLDMQAGRAVGAQLIMIGDPGDEAVDHSAPSLAAAVDWLLG